MYGYHCYECKTNTKDEYVTNCEYCNYEVCSNCKYNKDHKCGKKSIK